MAALVLQALVIVDYTLLTLNMVNLYTKCTSAFYIPLHCPPIILRDKLLFLKKRAIYC